MLCSSNWESSPNRGENKNYLKPPPRYQLEVNLVITTTLRLALRPCPNIAMFASEGPKSLGETGNVHRRECPSLPVIPPEVNGVWMVCFWGPNTSSPGVWKPRDDKIMINASLFT